MRIIYGKCILVRFYLCAVVTLGALAFGACTDSEKGLLEAPSGTTEMPMNQVWFKEVAAESGLDFVHVSGHSDRFLLPEIMGGGAALFDMDQDGDLDAYLVQSGQLDTSAEPRLGNQLFENLGGGIFNDITKDSGADDRGYGMGVAAGDYDNDGDIDLYVTNIGPNTLLRSEGNGKFTDVTKSAGVGEPSWSASAVFFDYDRDGDLDLYVTNYLDWSVETELSCYSLSGAPDYCSPKNYNAPVADTLYRNDGAGVFNDVSADAGLHTTFGPGLGVVTGDFDLNGSEDVFVTNDGMLNQLWSNSGSLPLVDVALERGVAIDQDGKTKAGMGVHATDVDNDGDLDLLVVNLDGESDSFYRNQRDFFTDDTAAVGLRAVSRPFTRFGIALLDFNNDGRLDLYQANGRVGLQSERFAADPYAEPNLLYRGTPEGLFEEVIPRGGTAELLVGTSRAAVFGDVNNDGGIDILVVNRDSSPYLLRNQTSNRGHWINFRVLEANGRDAIGSRVTMNVGTRRIERIVHAGYSYLGSNDPRVHVGIGTEVRVEDVTVSWPNGTLEDFGSFGVDQAVILRRGTAK
jgi:hypothetical protein